MQKWINLGPVLQIENSEAWMHSHVAVPTVERIGPNSVRIYFCSRDKMNRSQIGYAEIDVSKPNEILSISKQAIFSFGKLGTFDDSGVTPTQILQIGDETYLYYVGWSQSKTVRFQLAVGVARKVSENEFERISEAPVLGRTKYDPYLVATLSILRHAENDYSMWYISGDGWFARDGETFPLYNVKKAKSKNGLDWTSSKQVAIDYKSGDEHAIAKPTVIFENGIFKMWYSCKSHNYENYNLGYAESSDGNNWQRLDEKIHFDRDIGGFDEEMRAYPEVINLQSGKYMFFNGNGYGRSGIGLAVLDEDL
ncbi:hypothetical protein OAI58_09235 [Amylibacter sp.]|nr:hypothetical protein [Amylibacter sp.]